MKRAAAEALSPVLAVDATCAVCLEPWYYMTSSGQSTMQLKNDSIRRDDPVINLSSLSEVEDDHEPVALRLCGHILGARCAHKALAVRRNCPLCNASVGPARMGNSVANAPHSKTQDLAVVKLHISRASEQQWQDLRDERESFLEEKRFRRAAEEAGVLAGNDSTSAIHSSTDLLAVLRQLTASRDALRKQLEQVSSSLSAVSEERDALRQIASLSETRRTCASDQTSENITSEQIRIKEKRGGEPRLGRATGGLLASASASGVRSRETHPTRQNPLRSALSRASSQQRMPKLNSVEVEVENNQSNSPFNVDAEAKIETEPVRQPFDVDGSDLMKESLPVYMATTMCPSLDGSVVFVGGRDACRGLFSVRAYSVMDIRSSVRSFNGLTHRAPTSALLTLSSTMLCSACLAGDIQISDTRTGNAATSWPSKRNESVFGLATDGGNFVLAGEKGGTIQLLDLRRTNAPVRLWQIPQEENERATFCETAFVGSSMFCITNSGIFSLDSSNAQRCHGKLNFQVASAFSENADSVLLGVESPADLCHSAPFVSLRTGTAFGRKFHLNLRHVAGREVQFLSNLSSSSVAVIGRSCIEIKTHSLSDERIPASRPWQQDLLIRFGASTAGANRQIFGVRSLGDHDLLATLSAERISILREPRA